MNSAPVDTLELLLRDILRRLRGAPAALLVAFALFLLPGCGRLLSPPTAPPIASDAPVQQGSRPDDPIAARCVNDTECSSSAAPRCDTCDGACVACLAPSDCAGERLACIGHRCVGCTAHSDCASGRCRDDGYCAPMSAVTFVDHDHPCRDDAHASTASDPYCEIAAALPSTGEVVVQLAPSTTPYAAVLVDGHAPRDVSIMGPGADQAGIAAGANADAVHVDAQYSQLVSVLVHGVALLGSANGNACSCVTSSNHGKLTLDEVDASGSGTSGVASSYCALTLTNSSVHDNASVGVSVTGGLTTLSHDFVFGNERGGLYLAQTTGTFDHLTVASNAGLGAGGISCDGPNLIAESIVVDNASASATGTDAQIDARCLLDDTATGLGATRGLPCSPVFVSGQDLSLDMSTPAAVADNQCALGLGADAS